MDDDTGSATLTQLRPIPQVSVCTPDLLRSLFLFEALSDDQLAWLCREGRLEKLEPGIVYAQGEPATSFYVMVSGELVLSGRVGADDHDISRTSQPGVYAGAWQAYLGDQVPQIYNNTMRVTVPSTFFVLDAGTLQEMMQAWFPMALHLLEGLFFGIRNSLQATGQRERLQALGALSAGLTHELNNPASAAVRATEALRGRVAGMRRKLAFVASGGYDKEHLAELIDLQEEAAEQVAKAPVLSAMEASDREDRLTDWMDEHSVTGAWEIAPTFVQAGLDDAWLDRTLETVGAANLDGALHWLNYTIESELLMNEIRDSTQRISALVASARQYSQLDRAPFQTVDVHDLLDSTLVMLSAKLGKSVKHDPAGVGIRVVKEYTRPLPEIGAYAAELNQVWTNLIDNAIYAMGGHGTLTLRTSLIHDEAAEPRVVVEIGDTGPGIPEDVQSRIFEPFFTTKPVGEGTGLGLDISYRIVVAKHHGDLSVQSEPGSTWFRVELPVRAQRSES
jgi:signal transduction histidine kinase